ncbi:MAG: 3-oxoadipate enol-lactonase [Gaiellaceae bacterium]
MKPVLVLSNSLGTTVHLWDAQIPSLEGNFRVVRYDHRGHGGSALADEPVTVASLARDVVALLDRLEIERASFCGLSLGGMVGMALALEAPDRLNRLVLCCTAAYLGPPEGWYERARLVRARGTAAVAERVLERWFTERFRAEHGATVKHFRQMLEGTPREGYAACCEAIAGWDVRTGLDAIRAPTLVIAGADDVATPPEDAAFLAESIPGAELSVLPGAAHLANVEQRNLFDRVLFRHLTASTNSKEAA